MAVRVSAIAGTVVAVLFICIRSVRGECVGGGIPQCPHCQGSRFEECDASIYWAHCPSPMDTCATRTVISVRGVIESVQRGCQPVSNCPSPVFPPSPSPARQCYQEEGLVGHQCITCTDSMQYCSLISGDLATIMFGCVAGCILLLGAVIAFYALRSVRRRPAYSCDERHQHSSSLTSKLPRYETCRYSLLA